MREKKVVRGHLCSGLPLSAADAAQVEDREGFTQATHGKIAVRARPSAPT